MPALRPQSVPKAEVGRLVCSLPRTRAGGTDGRYGGKKRPCDAKRCVAPRAIGGKTGAEVGETGPRSLGASRRTGQRGCAISAKSLAGVLHQLLGDRQIDQRGIDVFVAEICRQIWKARLGIDALSIPIEHPVTDTC